jgi:hypothetical protein
VLTPEAAVLIGDYRVLFQADDPSRAIVCTFAALDTAVLIYLKLQHANLLY